MNPVDRVVEEHCVITGPVLRVLLRLVGDVDTMRGQELAMKEVDLFPAAGPQRDVIDANRLLTVRQLSAGANRATATRLPNES